MESQPTPRRYKRTRAERYSLFCERKSREHSQGSLSVSRVDCLGYGLWNYFRWQMGWRAGGVEGFWMSGCRARPQGAL
jgi:hypothetical protein